MIFAAQAFDFLYELLSMILVDLLLLVSSSFILNGNLVFYNICYSVQVKQLQNPDTVFETILGIVVRLAEHGLIHCDFNEFNIMVCL